MNENPDKKREGFLTLPMVRDLVVVLFLLIVSWNFINMEIKLDFSGFTFSDFLALILAIFSIGLSVAFYFKASETSNRFYDNSYKFTKEISEVLGRIEAGFGEKLRNMEEGYAGIREKFDRLPYGSNNDASVKAEKEEIKKKEGEYQAIIENLADRAKLADDERKKVMEDFSKKQEELEEARMQLRQLQAKSSKITEGDVGLRRSLLKYIADHIIEYKSRNSGNSFSKAPINEIFEKIRDELHPDAFHDLERFNLLTSRGTLNREAITRLGPYVRGAG